MPPVLIRGFAALAGFGPAAAGEFGHALLKRGAKT
jgi:hypothetical protein